MISRYASLIVIIASRTWGGNALEAVNISIQPAYHGIPIYAAKQFGWFEELGLDVELTVFASGAPQVKAAVDDKAWDIGIAGSVPNVLGGAQGLQTIAITNDESATTEVIGGPEVKQWPTQENIVEGMFAATPKSTGELLLRKCLERENLILAEGDIMYDQQKGVMAALVEDSDPDFACLWAPNTYTYREANPRAKVFCSGKNIDFPIYGGLMVRKDYGINNEATVAKVLAAWLRAITFMKNKENLDAVLKISAEYHEYSGTPISENALKEDLILRPIYDLDDQLSHLDRNFANEYTSEADRHYLALEEFLFQQNVIENKDEPKEYVTDAYMKMVSADPDLRAYSMLGASTAQATPSTSTASCINLGFGSVVGIIIGVVGILSL